MSVFISHVEEDHGTVEEIVRGLQAEGYEAWAYETNTLPGPTYLSQVVEAIEQASAVILVISPQALGSHQVAREIEVAHDMDRPIVPVLKGITHEKFQQRRPDWRLALGGYSSIAIPPDGVPAIMPRIVAGLKALGVAPGASGGPPPAAPATGHPPATGRAGVASRAKRRPWVIIALVLLAVALVGIAVIVLLPGGSENPATKSTRPLTEAQATLITLRTRATLTVEPKNLRLNGPIAVSYVITNRSRQDIRKGNMNITILVGRTPATASMGVGNTINRDIPAGSTVKGVVASTLYPGTPTGHQKILMTMGASRGRGMTISPQKVAEAPVTIGR